MSCVCQGGRTGTCDPDNFSVYQSIPALSGFSVAYRLQSAYRSDAYALVATRIMALPPDTGTVMNEFRLRFFTTGNCSVQLPDVPAQISSSSAVEANLTFDLTAYCGQWVWLYGDHHVVITGQPLNYLAATHRPNTSTAAPCTPVWIACCAETMDVPGAHAEARNVGDWLLIILVWIFLAMALAVMIWMLRRAWHARQLSSEQDMGVY